MSEEPGMWGRAPTKPSEYRASGLLLPVTSLF